MSDEIALSEQHDAAGRHDDAINALARATQAGSIEAMTRLAKRLVVGDRAPCLPKDGVRFLVDAANRGGAEAAGRLAVLSATGAYLPQSFSNAVEMLTIAAERGWPPARGQLAVLSTDRALATEIETNANARPDVWRPLAQSIDIEFWTTAADGTTLNDSPLVRSFPDFVSRRHCEWMIGRSEGRLERARVYDAFEGEETTNEIRTNQTAKFDLMDTDLVYTFSQARMAATAGMPLFNLEAPAILSYDPGEQIGEHYDFVDPRTPNYAKELAERGQRIITFLIYLNDEYDGGETEFPKFDLCHRGALGEGMFFVNALPDQSPDLRAVHAGKPTSRGTKWVLSQFIRDRRMLHTDAAIG